MGANLDYLPGEPLAEFIRERAQRADLPPSAYVAATLAGITTSRSYLRWERGAPIRGITADRVAIALGVHPATIWPLEWYASRIPDTDDDAA